MDEAPTAETPRHEARRSCSRACSALAGAYATAGVTRLVIAGSVHSNDGVDRLRAVLPFPLRVARLSAPLEVIEERLATAPTEERRLRDARAAAHWLRNGVGADVGEDASSTSPPPPAHPAQDANHPHGTRNYQSREHVTAHEVLTVANSCVKDAPQPNGKLR